MQVHNVKNLRALVETAQLLTDAERVELLADLRAEEFWSGRAPALNDELLALRPLEVFARTIANGGELPAARVDDLHKALMHLDAVREEQEKKAKRSGKA
ncbi:hypothetical protein [Bordetella phage vB_BbrM_PHB04]|uniref:Uncharacterized protein n=1 Tax=Bordetella phage vB_BbrM_PHB04 TaxID=2029657 RepID=A0A291L9Y0_9CAUD|nr:hypothetical protein HOS14_gp067 [Bordetella phage vB_BbrM_PHB04]ATI15685.1 hypothetical protein [Bordetella phage vB_BbrM_PHB04]